MRPPRSPARSTPMHTAQPADQQTRSSMNHDPSTLAKNSLKRLQVIPEMLILLTDLVAHPGASDLLFPVMLTRTSVTRTRTRTCGSRARTRTRTRTLEEIGLKESKDFKGRLNSKSLHDYIQLKQIKITAKCSLNNTTNICNNKMLSYGRETALQGAIVLAKCGRLEL